MGAGPLSSTARRELELQVCDLFLKRPPLKEVERWIYETSGLEILLGADTHVELISVDFRQPDARYQVEKLLEPHCKAKDFGIKLLTPILESIIAHDQDAWASLCTTYDLYCAGFTFLDSLALPFGLHLQDSEHMGTQKEVRARVDEQYAEVAQEAARILECLIDGTIEPVATDGCPQYGFIDRRLKDDGKR